MTDNYYPDHESYLLVALGALCLTLPIALILAVVIWAAT